MTMSFDLLWPSKLLILLFWAVFSCLVKHFFSLAQAFHWRHPDKTVPVPGGVDRVGVQHPCWHLEHGLHGEFCQLGMFLLCALPSELLARNPYKCSVNSQTCWIICFHTRVGFLFIFFSPHVAFLLKVSLSSISRFQVWLYFAIMLFGKTRQPGNSGHNIFLYLKKAPFCCI